MRVKIISKTMYPEMAVFVAAKTCYAKDTPTRLPDIWFANDSTTTDIIRKCRDSGHLSVFEHASFTFAIEGVSRSLSHQLVRHRIASYSQKSQRYVDEDGFGYVTPATMFTKPEILNTYTGVIDHIKKCYQYLRKEGVPKYGKEVGS
jgi:thymidylate synthase (FAD)